MKNISSKIGILALALSLAAPALADPKPKGARAPDAQSLANLYAGHSTVWKDCKGGMYYGGKWQAQAYCDKDGGKAIGLGTWSVTRNGKVCRTLKWYWPEGKKVGSKQEEKKCINHLVDANGTIWRNWDNDTEWWVLTPGENKGFRMKNKVNRMRRQLKI